MAAAWFTRSKRDSLGAGSRKDAMLETFVIIATNMAGRGTDIRLGQGVANRGGLHVILTEGHEFARIDRQLKACRASGKPRQFNYVWLPSR